MDEPHAPVVERGEEILAASVKVADAPAGQARDEVRRHAAAQTILADRDPGHGAATEVRSEATDERLDLGKLGHA